MEDVIDRKIASYLSANDYFYIYHRFGKEDTTHCFVGNANDKKWKLISVAIGVSDRWINILTDIKYDGFKIDVLTVDVAHGDHENVKNIISFIREQFPKTKIIAGNVATAEGYKYLYSLGVDAIKVGIGGGKICSTKNKTGFHIPTFQSILECSELGLNVPIIADGGIKCNGDIAKALVAGATMVMCGGLFASCIDSPAKIINGKKLYRGSTSYEAKGERKHIEGISLELDEGFTYAERLQEIKEDLQSSVSYAGGTDLKSLSSVSWGLVHH
jgi:GMP reductase